MATQKLQFFGQLLCFGETLHLLTFDLPNITCTRSTHTYKYALPVQRRRWRLSLLLLCCLAVRLWRYTDQLSPPTSLCMEPIHKCYSTVSSYVPFQLNTCAAATRLSSLLTCNRSWERPDAEITLQNSHRCHLTCLNLFLILYNCEIFAIKDQFAKISSSAKNFFMLTTS